MWQRLGVVAFWLTWPGLWFYLHWSRRTRLLLCVGDEILVTRTWLSDGRWSLPGGGLHKGEDSVQGVLREVSEETGISLRPDDIKPLTTDIFRYHGLSFSCQYFTANLALKPDVTLQRLEISGGRWVKWTDVNSKRFGPDVMAAVYATINGS